VNAIKKLKDNAKETNAKYAVITRFDETIIYDAKTGEEKAFFNQKIVVRQNEDLSSLLL